jgi:hypothetical protein
MNPDGGGEGAGGPLNPKVCHFSALNWKSCIDTLSFLENVLLIFSGMYNNNQLTIPILHFIL